MRRWLLMVFIALAVIAVAVNNYYAWHPAERPGPAWHLRPLHAPPKPGPEVKLDLGLLVPP